jgi:hypothetical protein
MEKKTRALKNFNAEVKERLSVSVVAHFFVYVAGKILMSGIYVLGTAYDDIAKPC